MLVAAAAFFVQRLSDVSDHGRVGYAAGGLALPGHRAIEMIKVLPFVSNSPPFSAPKTSIDRKRGQEDVKR
jgi:hypothetical protein